jgi:tRNA(fMet)-specific endonuclease VapC
MIRYLLDTNAFSYAIRKSYTYFSRRFESVRLDEIGISVITEAELLFGLAKRPEAYTLALSVNSLLQRIAIMPWTSDSAKAYAGIRAELERRGQRMDDMDVMIAAHALVEDAVLITNDAAFRRVQHLKMEDWTAS